MPLCRSAVRAADGQRQQDERQQDLTSASKAEADDPGVVRVLAALQVHDVQAPHEVVEAPPAGAPGDDLARPAIDVEMGVVAHSHPPAVHRPAQLERRAVGVDAADFDHFRRAGIARHDLADRVGGAEARQKPAGGRIGQPLLAVGEIDFPARPVGARLQRMPVTWRALRPAAPPAGRRHCIGLGGAIRCSPRTSSIGLTTITSPETVQNSIGNADQPAQPDVPAAQPRTNSPHSNLPVTHRFEGPPGSWSSLLTPPASNRRRRTR